MYDLEPRHECDRFNEDLVDDDPLHHYRGNHGLAAAEEGTGRDQLRLVRWLLEQGSHCRTGFEDNVRLDKDTLAPSNATLVRQVVDLCAAHGRHPASVAEARQLLSLPAAG